MKRVRGSECLPDNLAGQELEGLWREAARRAHFFVAQLAEDQHLDRRALDRQFVRLFGSCPRKVLRKWWGAEAKRLLRQNGWVAGVASDLGYQ